MPNNNDTVYLEIGGKKIEYFISYSIESNLFVADDPFTLELANPGVKITPGQQCKLYVNDSLELHGIIDRRERSSEKSSRTLTISGRDLMGLVVDAYADNFVELNNVKLRDLTETLLKPIPFIKRKSVIYGKGDKDRAVAITKTEEEYDISQIEPGQTVFEALKNHAMSRGLLFYCDRNGIFVYGSPLTKGKALFNLVRRFDSKGNNIKKGTEVDDISGRYKTIKVAGQQQGSDATAVGEHNFDGIAVDPSFPFEKTFVATVDDGQDPDKYAAILMSKQIFEGYQLDYTVKGHSQGDRNWQANAICHVEDEDLEIDGDFLIYSRAFTRSKADGTETALKLSKLGALPA